jgi:hypothetical protein
VVLAGCGRGAGAHRRIRHLQVDYLRQGVGVVVKLARDLIILFGIMVAACTVGMAWINLTVPGLWPAWVEPPDW